VLATRPEVLPDLPDGHFSNIPGYPGADQTQSGKNQAKSTGIGQNPVVLLAFYAYANALLML
jgi:hypothetical protein